MTNFAVLYHDDDYAVVIKPYGMLSEAAGPNDGDPAAPDMLAEKLGIPVDSVHVVHRLDRTTEGLMVFALNPVSAARLSSIITGGNFSKKYLAVFSRDGTLPESGEMRDMIYFDRRSDKSYVTKGNRKGAKDAVLRYRITGSFPYRDSNLSVAEVELETGRTHQIRVQFASRRSPLAGDGKYGSRVKYREPSLFSVSLSFPWKGSQSVFFYDPDIQGCSVLDTGTEEYYNNHRNPNGGSEMRKVIVETSARHVHLTEEHIAILFGKGHKLTHKKDLSQPGQFACEERVTVVGPKKSIPNVSILGPARSATQVEVSFTDARTLGVTAPVRESGDIKGSAGCKIIGPEGEIDIEEGVIVAKRHIHFTPEDAEEFGVKDKQVVSVKIESEGRSLIFGDVVVRVSPKFAAAMHIDTDESNAAAAFGTVWGEVIK
ncbi:MAG: phosphate propanoyltransferase [Clostridia bacterium]|nr:phosphate propanoyltransferase [Clostridia bacterium]